jgi:hypothetical protein
LFLDVDRAQEIIRADACVRPWRSIFLDDRGMLRISDPLLSNDFPPGFCAGPGLISAFNSPLAGAAKLTSRHRAASPHQVFLTCADAHQNSFPGAKITWAVPDGLCRAVSLQYLPRRAVPVCAN